MPQYEYKVVPAPAKGLKARGIKTPEARFAHSVESLLNTLGAEGWEYLRAELLPSDERSGLTGSTTNWRNVLVFRRVVASETEMFQPRVLPPVVALPEAIEETAPEATPDEMPAPDPALEVAPMPEAAPEPGVIPEPETARETHQSKVPKAILQFTNMTGRDLPDDDANADRDAPDKITPGKTTQDKTTADADPKT